jgi:hypothetical protein
MREILNWGTHLYGRLLKTMPQDAVHAIFVGLFFRRVLEVMDLGEAALREGQIGGANINVRCMLEAVWSLEYGLSDIPMSTRCMLVWSRRRDREWHLRLIPGTSQNVAFQEEMPSLTGRMAGKVIASALADDLKRIDDLLRDEPYASLNQRFDYIRGTRLHDPHWFAPAILGSGERRYPSYLQLARAAGHRDEYTGFYTTYSSAVHGSGLRDAMSFGKDRIEFEPIRGVEGFAAAFTLLTFLPIRVYRLMLETFRPEELNTFRATYMGWRDRLNQLPSIRINPHYQQL